MAWGLLAKFSNTPREKRNDFCPELEKCSSLPTLPLDWSYHFTEFPRDLNVHKHWSGGKGPASLSFCQFFSGEKRGEAKPESGVWMRKHQIDLKWKMERIYFRNESSKSRQRTRFRISVARVFSEGITSREKSNIPSKYLSVKASGTSQRKLSSSLGVLSSFSFSFSRQKCAINWGECLS